MTARKGTAERITETTTKRTTKRVTERLTVEQPAPPPPAGPPSIVTARFAHLLRCPPEGARWAHPQFIADEAARAVAQAPPEPFTVEYDPAPLTVVDVPRVPYPPLDPDTLAHEFTEEDRDRLAWTLSDVGY